MRAVIQRVTRAEVSVNGNTLGEIQRGLLILLGISIGDTEKEVSWLSRKIASMRIFADSEGLMNLDLASAGGRCLVVSQFTLYASTVKGNRPSFLNAARPEVARPLYERFVTELNNATGTICETGVFGADMQVTLVNDGPVTIVIDTSLRE